MEYFTHRRFKTNGIDGEFNLKYGTIVTERGGMLHAPDGRRMCAATSENGWEHFHPNTPEGAYRQSMIDALYKLYTLDASGDKYNEDFAARIATETNNTYWRSIIRTSSTDVLAEICKKRGLTLCTA